MQLVYNPDDEKAQVRTIRFVAQCAKCRGEIEIAEGGRRFPDRLVGRCRRSPREHLYSFDHALLVGSPLA